MGEEGQFVVIFPKTYLKICSSLYYYSKFS